MRRFNYAVSVKYTGLCYLKPSYSDQPGKTGVLSETYIAALVIPIITMVPALIINFSFILLTILIALIGLLLFRFFVIFTKIACVHCQAKNICPQAKSMGFSNE